MMFHRQQELEQILRFRAAITVSLSHTHMIFHMQYKKQELKHILRIHTAGVDLSLALTLSFSVELARFLSRVLDDPASQIPLQGMESGWEIRVKQERTIE